MPCPTRILFRVPNNDGTFLVWIRIVLPTFVNLLVAVSNKMINSYRMYAARFEDVKFKMFARDAAGY